MNGTILAHADGGIPIIQINIDKIDEFTLGELFYTFEFACGVSGYTLGVNPFNQPGVESYKKNMFALLGKPGNEELGKVLIKGFLFAQTQLENLPDTILFYNGGAKLTCEGSDSIEDLKKLEEAGVRILTCGTCLNYYGLTEKLKVGGVTNMYVIAQTMAEADLVVRP